MKDKELASYARSCLKKHRYTSEQKALEVINKIHKERKDYLRVYFCKFCLGYHLTHIHNKREKANDSTIKDSKIN